MKIAKSSQEAKSAAIATAAKSHSMTIMKILCSLLITFILYGDGMAMLSEYPILCSNDSIKYVETDRDSSIVFGKYKLTMPKLLFYFFNAGSVFAGIPVWNIEFAIYGRHVGADPKQPWDDLNYFKDCFPYECRGENVCRLDFAWHALIGKDSTTKAMHDLATKIKNKYNREHPQEPIDKVAVYQVYWPRSEDGWYTLKKPENTHWNLVAEE